MQRVEASATVDTRVDVATPSAHREMEVGSAARAKVERGKPIVEHGGVEDDTGIGAALVLPDPRSGTLAPDLFLGVAEHTDVNRQCAFERKAARCFEQEPELPLVVGHAAAVQPAVANGRLERRALPEFKRCRRLDVDMPVAEDSRGALSEARDDANSPTTSDPVTPSTIFASPPAPSDKGDDPIERALHISCMERIGAHARDSEQLEQRTDPGQLHERNPTQRRPHGKRPTDLA